MINSNLKSIFNLVRRLPHRIELRSYIVVIKVITVYLVSQVPSILVLHMIHF